MYDEETDANVPAKLTFTGVAAIDFRINYFESMIGAEASGLYCITEKEFIQAVVKGTFDRRKEMYLLEGDYNYDPADEHDMLNNMESMNAFFEDMDEYCAYVQNVDAGVYIIVAKKLQIEREL